VVFTVHGETVEGRGAMLFFGEGWQAMGSQFGDVSTGAKRVPFDVAPVEMTELWWHEGEPIQGSFTAFRMTRVVGDAEESGRALLDTPPLHPSKQKARLPGAPALQSAQRVGHPECAAAEEGIP